MHAWVRHLASISRLSGHKSFIFRNFQIQSSVLGLTVLLNITVIFLSPPWKYGSGYFSRYSYSVRAGRSGDRIPVGIFRNCPDRPWDPRSLLFSGYRISFPGVKRPGRCVYHPPPSSAEVKERVQLYLYSNAGTSWSVLGWNSPLPLPPWKWWNNASSMVTVTSLHFLFQIAIHPTTGHYVVPAAGSVVKWTIISEAIFFLTANNCLLSEHEISTTQGKQERWLQTTFFSHMTPADFLTARRLNTVFVRARF